MNEYSKSESTCLNIVNDLKDRQEDFFLRLSQGLANFSDNSDADHSQAKESGQVSGGATSVNSRLEKIRKGLCFKMFKEKFDKSCIAAIDNEYFLSLYLITLQEPGIILSWSEILLGCDKFKDHVAEWKSDPMDTRYYNTTHSLLKKHHRYYSADPKEHKELLKNCIIHLVEKEKKDDNISFKGVPIYMTNAVAGPSREVPKNKGGKGKLDYSKM